MENQRKVALVTGGARGIGLGVALKLADAGFALAISGRRTCEQVQPALDQIRSQSAASIYVQADVSNGADRTRLASSSPFYHRGRWLAFPKARAQP